MIQNGVTVLLNGSIYMILSEDCALAEIREIGEKAGFSWELAQKARLAREWNYIWMLRQTD